MACMHLSAPGRRNSAGLAQRQSDRPLEAEKPAAGETRPPGRAVLVRRRLQVSLSPAPLGRSVDRQLAQADEDGDGGM